MHQKLSSQNTDQICTVLVTRIVQAAAKASAPSQKFSERLSPFGRRAANPRIRRTHQQSPATTSWWQPGSGFIAGVDEV